MVNYDARTAEGCYTYYLLTVFYTTSSQQVLRLKLSVQYAGITVYFRAICAFNQPEIVQVDWPTFNRFRMFPSSLAAHKNPITASQLESGHQFGTSKGCLPLHLPSTSRNVMAQLTMHFGSHLPSTLAISCFVRFFFFNSGWISLKCSWTITTPTLAPNNGKEEITNLMGAHLSLGCDSVSISSIKLVEFTLCARIWAFLRYTSSRRKHTFSVIQRSW